MREAEMMMVMKMVEEEHAPPSLLADARVTPDDREARPSSNPRSIFDAARQVSNEDGPGHQHWHQHGQQRRRQGHGRIRCRRQQRVKRTWKRPQQPTDEVSSSAEMTTVAKTTSAMQRESCVDGSDEVDKVQSQGQGQCQSQSQSQCQSDIATPITFAVPHALPTMWVAHNAVNSLCRYLLYTHGMIPLPASDILAYDGVQRGATSAYPLQLRRKIQRCKRELIRLSEQWAQLSRWLLLSRNGRGSAVGNEGDAQHSCHAMVSIGPSWSKPHIAYVVDLAGLAHVGEVSAPSEVDGVDGVVGTQAISSNGVPLTVKHEAMLERKLLRAVVLHQQQEEARLLAEASRHQGHHQSENGLQRQHQHLRRASNRSRGTRRARRSTANLKLYVSAWFDDWSSLGSAVMGQEEEGAVASSTLAEHCIVRPATAEVSAGGGKLWNPKACERMRCLQDIADSCNLVSVSHDGVASNGGLQDRYSFCGLDGTNESTLDDSEMTEKYMGTRASGIARPNGAWVSLRSTIKGFRM